MQSLFGKARHRAGFVHRVRHLPGGVSRARSAGGLCHRGGRKPLGGAAAIAEKADLFRMTEMPRASSYRPRHE